MLLYYYNINAVCIVFSYILSYHMSSSVPSIYFKDTCQLMLLPFCHFTPTLFLIWYAVPKIPYKYNRQHSTITIVHCTSYM